MNRRGRPLAFLSRGALAASLLTFAACSEDEFSDAHYGFIDLAPYYFDGSTAAQPTRGLPDTVAGLPAWHDGVRVHLYDFGLIGGIRQKRSATGATLAEPEVALVHPMYFFFDSAGNPMTSKPIYDERTGTFFMNGGKDTLDPNPNADGANDTFFNLPYSARTRNVVTDSKRGTADYQRPIIDLLQDSNQYSGLWEVVEIQAPSGYQPDAIKSVETLKAAVESGSFKAVRTQRVINCPVMDDRTQTVPTSMVYRMKPSPYMVVQPRVEVWYRTKLGSCYLANGFETIGWVSGGNDGENDPRDRNNVNLFSLGQAANEGIDTFDVIRYQVGEGDAAVLAVEVPVGNLYRPKSTVFGADVRLPAENLVTALPRHFPDDPPGYSPILWHWDIAVPSDYANGSYKSVGAIEPGKLTARGGVWRSNAPVVGVATPCPTGNECGAFGTSCNVLPNEALVAGSIPSGKNIADVMIEQEGGPRCDVKVVGYGEFCAPGISRCEVNAPAGSNNANLLTQFGSGDPGPSLTVHKALTDAMAGTDAGAIASAQTKVDYYKSWGYHQDLSPKGYSCHPPTGGYCYVRCDGGSKGTVKAEKRMITYKNARTNADIEEEVTFNTYPACGLANGLGYDCVGNQANKLRVCLRTCSTANSDNKNSAICGFPLNGTMDAGTDFAFSDGQQPGYLFPGQECKNLGGATACMWSPDLEPRGPNTRWPQ